MFLLSPYHFHTKSQKKQGLIEKFLLDAFLKMSPKSNNGSLRRLYLVGTARIPFVKNF